MMRAILAHKVISAKEQGLSQKLFKKQLAQPFSIQNRNISPKKTPGEKKEYKKKRIIKILVLEYEMNCEDSS